MPGFMFRTALILHIELQDQSRTKCVIWSNLATYPKISDEKIIGELDKYPPHYVYFAETQIG